MRTINIGEEGFHKFMAINESRKDASRAQTFDHILYVYEEQQFKHPSKIIAKGEPMHIVTGNVNSPIIDADKLQNKGAKL